MLLFQPFSRSAEFKAIWQTELFDRGRISVKCISAGLFLSLAKSALILSVLVNLIQISPRAAASQVEPNQIEAPRSSETTRVDPTGTTNQDREKILVQAVATDDWIEMKPKNAGATFKMITKPRYLERVFTPFDDQPSIKMRSFLSTFQNGDGLMVFMYCDLPTEPTGKGVVDTLEGIALGSVANLNGRITHHEKIRYKDYPGFNYEFRFAQDEQLHGGVGRAFLVGKRQFVISVMMKEASFDQAIALAYFESFRITVDDEADSDQTQSLSGKEKSIEKSQ